MNSPTTVPARKCRSLPFPVPAEVADLLDRAPAVTVAASVDELLQLAVRDAKNGVHEVAYDVPGKGRVVRPTSAACETASAPTTSSRTCGDAIPTAW